MPTTSFAVPADVTSRWVGAGAPTDADQLAVLIGDAGVLIRREFPDVDTRIAAPDDSLTAEDLKLVVVGMVSRLYRNPTGARQVQEGLGDHNESVSYGRDWGGALALTADDRDVLDGEPAGGPTAFSIDPTPAAGPGWLGGGPRDEPGWTTINGLEP